MTMLLKAREKAEPLFTLVDWLPPDFGAVGQYALIFARARAEAGRRVFLIGLTSGEAGIAREEFEGGGSLEVRRLRAWPVDKSRAFARLFWILRANLRLVREFVKNGESSGARLLIKIGRASCRERV